MRHRPPSPPISASILLVLIATSFATSLAGADARIAQAQVSDPCDVASLLSAPALRGARVGVLVERLRDGVTLFAHDAERPLAPASNQKLLTALAALATFGPAHRFATDVLGSEPDREGRVASLVLRASGDPALTTEDYARLAAELRRVGVRHIERLVVDDSAFDRERWHPAWGPVGSRAYEAPIGALMANYGSFAVTVRPGVVAGQPVRAAIEPPVASLPLVVRAFTAPLGAPSMLTLERSAGLREETLLVSGTLAVDSGEQLIYRSVADPTRYAAAVLVSSLAAAGIVLDKVPVVGAPPSDARLLLRFEGPELAEAVHRMLKLSSNPIAEGLLKSLGARASGRAGSFGDGAIALRAALEARGLDTRAAVFVDGSGLAASDRVTARLLVAALRSARGDFALGPELLASLPVAGRDGTLRQRAPAAAERVRAKTGTLTAVTSLSGFARSADDEELVFSWIVNGGDASAVKATDAFAESLARCATRAGRVSLQRLRALPLPSMSQSSEMPSFTASINRKSVCGVVPDS